MDDGGLENEDEDPVDQVNDDGLVVMPDSPIGSASNLQARSEPWH